MQHLSACALVPSRERAWRLKDPKLWAALSSSRQARVRGDCSPATPHTCEHLYPYTPPSMSSSPNNTYFWLLLRAACKQPLRSWTTINGPRCSTYSSCRRCSYPKWRPGGIQHSRTSQKGVQDREIWTPSGPVLEAAKCSRPELKPCHLFTMLIHDAYLNRYGNCLIKTHAYLSLIWFIDRMGRRLGSRISFWLD